MNNDLLLEIGTEEIPARFMPPAIVGLKGSAERLFKERRLQVRDIGVYGTPRRLVRISLNPLAIRTKRLGVPWTTTSLTCRRLSLKSLSEDSFRAAIAGGINLAGISSVPISKSIS